MKANVYHESEGDLSLIKDILIAVIGYGNQGRAQALNLRDSGLKVIIGNREDAYKKRAEKDGFETYNIEEAIKKAQIFFFLIPDEIMKELFTNEINPNLKENDTLVFASGYNIAFDIISPPPNVDILLIAPRMIGIGVRELYLNKRGFFTFIGVHQDASGSTKENLLALTKGVGGLIKGAIEVSFKQEAVLDLFNEQGFGPAFGQVLLKSIQTLLNANYPPEAVLVEMFMSGEMSYTYEKMAQVGLVKQTNFHSQTSQYGSMSRGIKFRGISKEIGKKQKEILEDIESGKFAKEWEGKLNKIKFKFIKFFATRLPFAKIEEKVRKSLKVPEYDIFREIPYPTEEDIKKSKEIEQEIKEFEDFYNEI
ncbi:MAG: ketol-acid reductoisomerase [Promethearchaeota archaeon]|nr:MAG: ketol-acid reductoisomerase [Candidatus Lokiarchaeota archaeon]